MAAEEPEEILTEALNGAVEDAPSAADAGLDDAAALHPESEVARKREVLRQHKIRNQRRKRQEPTKQRQELVRSLMATLQAAGDWPPPEQTEVQGLLCPGREARVDWERIPPSLDPARGGRLREEKRGIRKRHQVESLLLALQSLLPLSESLRARLGDSERVEVIDWCSGSGNASLVLAYLLPHCHFTLIDKQGVALALALQRAQSAGLRNVSVKQALVQEGLSPSTPLHLGLAIHACGSASDIVHDMCLARGVPYVIAPCCVGKVDKPHMVGYQPHTGGDNVEACTGGGIKSQWLSSLLHSQEQPGYDPPGLFSLLAGGADNHDNDNDNEEGQSTHNEWAGQCRLVLEVDRCRYARDKTGCTTLIATMHPTHCTPKHHVLLGVPDWAGPEGVSSLTQAAHSPHSTHRTPPLLPLPPLPCAPEDGPSASGLRIPDHLSAEATASLVLGTALGAGARAMPVHVHVHVHVGLLYGRGGGLLHQAEREGQWVIGIDHDPQLSKAIHNKALALGVCGNGQVQVVAQDPPHQALAHILTQHPQQGGTLGWVMLCFPIFWTRKRHLKRRLVGVELVRVLSALLPSSARGVMLCTEREAQADEATALFATHAPHLTRTPYTLTPQSPPRSLPSHVPCGDWLLQQRRQHPTIFILLFTPTPTPSS